MHNVNAAILIKIKFFDEYLSFKNPPTITLKKAIESVKLDPDLIDELIIGHVLQAGCGQAPAKQLAYKSGIHMKIPCTSINKVCSSGIKAICLAAQSIELGINEVVVAGGIESMSQAPYYLKSKNLEKIKESDITNGLFYDGLTDFKEIQPLREFFLYWK